MSRPLISLLLITYNQEDFIVEALESALAQTYAPLEIVVSDDVSSDGTYAAAERRIAAYGGPHRVVLRRNSARRNVVGHIADAVPATSGELIVVAAGDDVSLPDRVEKLAAAWQSSGRRAHALNSDLQQVDEAGVHGAVLAGCGGRSRFTLTDMVDRHGAFFGASAAYSRAVFERFGPLDAFNIFEDQILPFRAALLGEVVILDQALVLWRRLARSNSRLYLDRPAELKARLAKVVYQQRQQAAYQRQRLLDLEKFLQDEPAADPSLHAWTGKLRRLADTADAAAAALQRPWPSWALLRAAMAGKLTVKQAAKLVVSYRWPGLSDWWYRLRMAGKR